MTAASAAAGGPARATESPLRAGAERGPAFGRSEVYGAEGDVGSYERPRSRCVCLLTLRLAVRMKLPQAEGLVHQSCGAVKGKIGIGESGDPSVSVGLKAILPPNTGAWPWSRGCPPCPSILGDRDLKAHPAAVTVGGLPARSTIWTPGSRVA